MVFEIKIQGREILMIQEKLNALMSENIKNDIGTKEEFVGSLFDEPFGYTKDTAHYWPYPATDENKMVNQLDDITKESEEKATEIFDIIESVSNGLLEKEQKTNKVVELLNSNIKLFAILSTKFPDVKAFKIGLDTNKSALSDANEVVDMLLNSGDSMMSVMDIMQYQGIHRQKIERVINVMRSLSNYMNNILESRMNDRKRVSSAQHIAGDVHNNLVSNDDIEALLTQFGNQHKK